METPKFDETSQSSEYNYNNTKKLINQMNMMKDNQSQLQSETDSKVKKQDELINQAKTRGQSLQNKNRLLDLDQQNMNTLNDDINDDLKEHTSQTNYSTINSKNNTNNNYKPDLRLNLDTQNKEHKFNKIVDLHHQNDVKDQKLKSNNMDNLEDSYKSNQKNELTKSVNSNLSMKSGQSLVSRQNKLYYQSKTDYESLESENQRKDKLDENSIINNSLFQDSVKGGNIDDSFITNKDEQNYYKSNNVTSLSLSKSNLNLDTARDKMQTNRSTLSNHLVLKSSKKSDPYTESGKINSEQISNKHSNSVENTERNTTDRNNEFTNRTNQSSKQFKSSKLGQNRLQSEMSNIKDNTDNINRKQNSEQIDHLPVSPKVKSVISEQDIMQKLIKLELMADEYLSRKNQRQETEGRILSELSEIKQNRHQDSQIDSNSKSIAANSPINHENSIKKLNFELNKDTPPKDFTNKSMQFNSEQKDNEKLEINQIDYEEKYRQREDSKNLEDISLDNNSYVNQSNTTNNQNNSQHMYSNLPDNIDQKPKLKFEYSKQQVKSDSSLPQQQKTYIDQHLHKHQTCSHDDMNQHQSVIKSDKKPKRQQKLLANINQPSADRNDKKTNSFKLSMQKSDSARSCLACHKDSKIERPNSKRSSKQNSPNKHTSKLSSARNINMNKNNDVLSINTSVHHSKQVSSNRELTKEKEEEFNQRKKKKLLRNFAVVLKQQMLKCLDEELGRQIY